MAVKRKTAKRKTAKRKTAKRKTAKRKTAKRKTAKRKTAKRKTAKRKTAKRKTLSARRLSARRLSARRLSARRLSARRLSARLQSVRTAALGDDLKSCRWKYGTISLFLLVIAPGFLSLSIQYFFSRQKPETAFEWTSQCLLRGLTFFALSVWLSGLPNEFDGLTLGNIGDGFENLNLSDFWSLIFWLMSFSVISGITFGLVFC